MKKIKFKSLSIGFLIATTSLISCNNNDDDTDKELNSSIQITKNLSIPSELTIDEAFFMPEDIVIADGKAYISGFGNGTVKYFDLKGDAKAKTFANAEKDFAQSWGLASDGKVLLNILNNTNFDDLTKNGASKLVQYSIATGQKTNEWILPANGVNNSVQIVNGKYYVCEWAPAPKITQIDPVTGTINGTWFTSTKWDPTAGPLGGVVYNNENAFYACQGGKMWYLPIVDEKPGKMEQVAISGIDNIDCDGITWAGNNTLYYAENDATTPGNFGKVYKIKFKNTTTATSTVFKDGLNDSSGVWYIENDGQKKLFILESQIGVAFGASYSAPFKAKIFQL